jgi:multidrug efflux pump
VILGISEAQQTVSFEAMADRQQRLAQTILSDPAVESLSSFIGIDGTNTTINSGRIQINLKPLDVRGTRAIDIIRRLQPELAKVPGIQLYMQPVQDLTVEDRVSRTQYQYSIEDLDAQELRDRVPGILKRLQSLPQLRDVATDLQDGGLQARLIIDRRTAARFGITPQLIDDTLYDAFGQRQISTLFTQLNQYRVVLEAEPQFRQGPDDFANIYVNPPPGTTTTVEQAVPLGAFTRLEKHSVPLSINRQGQFPAVTMSFNLAPRVSLGEAVRAIEQAVGDLQLPAAMVGSFQGTSQAFRTSLKNEPLLILAALITVYIVLGVLYESYIHPITILSTLPSAGVGALLALLIFGQEMDVIALIGIILLIGIVKKNGIMMIDFALDAERQEGKPPEEAIYQASLLRFRPIMMTTMAALFAGVPLAFGGGTGSELRRPLGLAIIGGLIFSQLLTLYTTPVIYLTFDRVASRFRRRAGSTNRSTDNESPEAAA